MQAPTTSIRVSDNHKKFLVASVPCALDGRNTRGISTRIAALIDETIDERIASEVVEFELARVELLGSKPTWEDIGGDV